LQRRSLGFAPFVSQTLPQSTGLVGTVSKDITQIAAVIGEVETAGFTASRRAEAYRRIAARRASPSAIIATAGKKIANEALFQQGAKKIADGMADVLNSIHEDSLKTPLRRTRNHPRRN
jgi:hypothetical protein